MKFYNIVVWLLLMTMPVIAFSQVDNDVCDYSKFISNTDNYCSNPGEFTNVGSTPDPVFANTCVSLTWKNGVWFSFIAKAPGIAIQVLSNATGGIKNPKIVLFDDCNTLNQCSPGKTITLDELLVDNLVIGKLYYIMVESSIDGEGAFKLCLNSFIPVKLPESDCVDGVVLCDKTPFYVQSLTGSGNNTNEIENGNCINDEFQSSWYKWTCDESGTLTFVLTPNNNQEAITDDIDFAVYKLPNGLNDCSNKQLVRCEAAGANVTNGGVDPVATWAACNGPTGLRIGETDITEQGGCNSGQNNYVKELNMISGESYVLVINNFSRSGLGFSIEFGGTGTFLGPKVDFDIDALTQFECDKSILFTDQSSSTTDPIVAYNWSFGYGGNIETANTAGPHTIVYGAFGEKTAALTVTSSRGCTVTKIVDFYVNSCCADFSLDLDADLRSPSCFGLTDGQILAVGIAGNPKYEFSLNNKDFQPNPKFGSLPAGQYLLYIRDIKGCVDSLVVDLEEPILLKANAGEDISLELGDSTQFNGSYSPNFPANTEWTPPTGVNDVTDLSSVVTPQNNGIYVLTVTDENGCTSTDEVEIRVTKVRYVTFPNIIDGNSVDGNDQFYLTLGKGSLQVDQLSIYDRWGNKVYEGRNIPKGEKIGWNGIFDGRKVLPGVYAWVAAVRFIDDEVVYYKGDLTVVWEKR